VVRGSSTSDPIRGQPKCPNACLLHEFGHVINLLPLDFDNVDGKSVQNTAEVLRYCRAESMPRAGGARYKPRSDSHNLANCSQPV